MSKQHRLGRPKSKLSGKTFRSCTAGNRRGVHGAAFNLTIERPSKPMSRPCKVYT